MFVNTLLESPLRHFVAGRSSGGWRARLLPGHDLYRHPSLRTLKAKTHSIEWDLSDWLEWAAYFGISDPGAEQLTALLNPGDVALDIGSNIGSMLVEMAKVSGPTGFVYGFEPQTSRFTKCQSRLRYHEISNASVEHLALGSKNSVVEIVSPDTRNAGRARVRGQGDQTAAVDKIKCLPVDTWLEEKKLSKLNVVKIDVEGFEFEVLKGMQKTLERFSPILFIEIDDANLKLQGSSASEVLAWLKAHGYVIDELQTKRDHFDLIARK